jgi:nitrous oxidase accessory protein NosD
VSQTKRLWLGGAWDIVVNDLRRSLILLIGRQIWKMEELPRSFQDLCDLSMLFASLDPNATEVILSEPIYDMADFSFGIRTPVTLTSSCNSKLICRRLAVTSPDVTIRDIQIEGAIVARRSSNLVIQDCTITRGDPGSGGAIVLTDCQSVTITHVTVRDLVRSAGVFAEIGTTFTLSDSSIVKLEKSSAVSISAASKGTILKCRLGESLGAGVDVSTDCSVEIDDCEIYQTTRSLISVVQGGLVFRNCRLHDCEVTSVLIHECNDFVISKNDVRSIKSSGISAYASRGEISENHFEKVEGNALFLADDCEVTATKNDVSGTVFPGIAVLKGSKAELTENVITRAERSGICIRGAKSVTLTANHISGCGECGVSVSDTESVTFTRNHISDCRVSGLEVYNESQASIEGNEFVNTGKYAISVFTGARVSATRNSVRHVLEAFVHFNAFGGGDLVENSVAECPNLVVGRTNTKFFLSANGDFESFTDDADRATETVLFKSLEPDPLSGLCLGCGKAPRQGFCDPCGHRAFCNECGRAIAALADGEESDGHCPLCRFPVTAFTEAFELGNGGICPICSEEPADSIVLPCGHVGCGNCMKAWFARSGTCPVCRTERVHFRKILPDY